MGADKDVIVRLTDKELAAAKAFDRLNEKSDKPVGGTKLAEIMLKHYKTAEHPEYTKLREDKEYISLLDEYDKI